MESFDDSAPKTFAESAPQPAPVVALPWWERPMVALDFEASDKNPVTARIVQIGFHAGEQEDAFSALVNPGVPMAPEAAEVTGLTDEILQRSGVSPRASLMMLAAMLEASFAVGDACAVVIYNARYDWPLLWTELRRKGVSLDLRGVPIIDPLVIDKQVDKFRRGSRKLVDTAKLYGVELGEAAHDASADALAALLVARAIGRKYAKLLPPDPGVMFSQQKVWAASQQQSLNDYWARIGDPRRATGSWPWGDLRWDLQSPEHGLYLAGPEDESPPAPEASADAGNAGEAP